VLLEVALSGGLSAFPVRGTCPKVGGGEGRISNIGVVRHAAAAAVQCSPDSRGRRCGGARLQRHVYICAFLGCVGDKRLWTAETRVRREKRA
jgi:hypothetical protein